MKKIVLCLVALLCVCNSFSPVTAKNLFEKKTTYSIESYNYPITPDDNEWDLLGTVQNKIEACRIPSATLENMTNEALIQAILDFPFLCDIFAYNNYDEAITSFEKKCDAYAELLERNNAKESLINTLSLKNENMSKTRFISAEEEIENDALAMLTMYQTDFSEELTTEEMYLIGEFSNTISYINSQVATLDYIVDSEHTDIFTPNDTAVPYYVRECNHSTLGYHPALDNDVVEAYGVTLVSYGSCKYNCHSYAWYDQSTSNECWINFPIAYMTDGSYSKVIGSISTSSIRVANGDIVFYGTNTAPSHSAIICSSISGAPLATRSVKSKWGILGVFVHSVTNVPESYDLNNVSAWHR